MDEIGPTDRPDERRMTDSAPSGADTKTPASFSREIAGDLEELSRLTEELEEFSETHGVPPAQAQRVTLSVDELVTNIINYGSPDGSIGAIQVQVEVDAGAVRIEIEHRGFPFNPFEEVAAPDTSLPLEERPIGGLGVFLVKSLMTSVHYEHQNGRNLVVLTRSLDDAGKEETS